MTYRYGIPRYPLHQLRDEMDRLLTGVSQWLPGGAVPAAGRGQPAVNAWESGEALHAEVEVPGVSADQIDLAVVGDALNLTVRREEKPEQGITYHRRERPVGSFTRVLRLPVEVDADRVSADLRNGVLTVTMPKAEAAKPRKIPVASA